MKNFKFDLDAKVAIYVPSTTDVNIPTDNKKFVNKVMTKFSEWVLCHGAHFKLSKQCTLKR